VRGTKEFSSCELEGSVCSQVKVLNGTGCLLSKVVNRIRPRSSLQEGGTDWSNVLNAWLELMKLRKPCCGYLLYSHPWSRFNLLLIDYLSSNEQPHLSLTATPSRYEPKQALHAAISYVFGSSTGKSSLVPALHTVCKKILTGSPLRLTKPPTNPSDQSKLRMLSLFCRVSAAHLMIAERVYT
jgi:hypothetical protein